MRIFAGVAGAHGKHLKIKNCGKILEFTSQIKRSAPREWEGQMRSIGEGLSHDRESQAKRRGGAKRGNLCEFQNLVYIYLETVIDQKDGVSSVDSTYSFYFSGSGDRNHQGTERRRRKTQIGFTK